MAEPSNAACLHLLGVGGKTEVRVCIEDDAGERFLVLSSESCNAGGDYRLRLAALRLFELDAALELAVRRGEKIRVALPGPQSQSDERHSPAQQIGPLLMPLAVRDELFPYQRHGVAWLLTHRRALLGDDMGLGKTAQAIAATRRLIRVGKIAWSIVVAPRTLIANWVAEIRRWAPELSIATALPIGGARESEWQGLVRRAHVLITSYEQFRDPPPALIANPPDLIIADEAHRLRRAQSRSTQGFRTVETKWLWALTGTPIENDAEDLAVLMSLLDSAKFSADDKALHPTSLRARLRPYMLRRRKTDVLNELPEVIEQTETLDLTPEQQAAYRAAINEHKASPASANFLLLFNKLRALCDVEPRSGASSKLDRVVELLSDIQEAGEKAVVFSYVLEPLRWLDRRLRRLKSSIGATSITGEMTLAERSRNIKKFTSDPSCTALLASTRVASEGLTLTAANHVIFISRWWNPSANAQARDRIVRIGQSRMVQVTSFTCRQTVEQRLDELLQLKMTTFDDLINSLASDIEDQDKDFLLKS